MKSYEEMTKEELLKEKEGLEAEYKKFQQRGLKLDMSRGKPSQEQLDLSMGMMDVLTSGVDLTCDDGTDCRNYGVLDGISEAKQLIGDMIECNPDNIIIYGNSSLTIATSANNLEDIKKQLKIQTIGHDKVNQLRHVRFFKDIHGITEHMRKHADSLRPKFEMILDTFERELKGLGAGSWYSPKGGYFITYETLDGCAKNVVAKAKKAGVVMTPAGAPFPYGKDPHDSVIRISPSYPSLEDLTTAIDIFVVCVKLASIEKLLGE